MKRKKKIPAPIMVTSRSYSLKSVYGAGLSRIRRLAPLAFTLFTLPAWAGFSISGKIGSGAAGTEIVLYRIDIDSNAKSEEGRISVAADGVFRRSFYGEPGLFSLDLPSGQALGLAIDQDQNVEIVADPNDATGYSVAGSPDTLDLRAYEDFRKDSLTRLVYPPRAQLNAAKENPNAPSGLMTRLAKAEVQGYTAHRRELNDFSIDRIGDSIVLYATSLRWDPDYRLKELQGKVDAFAEERSELAITASMQTRLQRFARTAIGSVSSPISGRSLDGKYYSLADFRGKYVLVDFWASWCVPCRVENRLYNQLLPKYADHPFAIFAVNLDDNRQIWEMASKRDRVVWPQISDSLGWQSPLAATYNVTALPMSFLMDPDGRIIYRNLRGEALETKLAELFE
tara:strand:- start:161 stop:1354 length:1194 start_codon:yes stop_codon:yes gene_type:complete